MIDLLRKLYALLSRRERIQFGFLTGALILRACAEMIGVASIAPFMSVVADPNAIETKAALRWAYAEFGFTSHAGFLMALGLAVIFVVAISSTVSALALWGMLRFSWATHHRLAMRLFQGYLRQPYSFFTERNSSRLSKAILADTRNIIEGILTPALNVLSRALVVLALTGLLTALDPVLAALVVGVLGGSYAALFLALRQKQRVLGEDRNVANAERFKTVEETFGGIKDVKVLGREEFFRSMIQKPSWTFSRTTATNTTIAYLPRYVLETIALAGIVVIVLYHVRSGRGLAAILPVLSLYAFAGYRLVPELQQVFIGISNIRFYKPALDELSADLRMFERSAAIVPRSVEVPAAEEIRFEHVTMRYPTAPEPVLRDVSLAIRRNQTVAFVGPTGSGKTTLVDILLGLYEPTSGRVMMGSSELNASTVSSWRRRIGYVPQNIFVSDDTIARNIAFGLPPAEIDEERVRHAAAIAHLHDFVKTLPKGYETVVGERGVRLSGGQKQRIAIARALYHEPDVLVMDEATSALDGATESAVMEAIHELAGRKTIVLVAHRMTTVREADLIYMLRDGRIEAVGRYADLIRWNASFRAMAMPAEQPFARSASERVL